MLLSKEEDQHRAAVGSAHDQARAAALGELLVALHEPASPILSAPGGGGVVDLPALWPAHPFTEDDEALVVTLLGLERAAGDDTQDPA